MRVRYLHSDIDTLERVEILRDLRRGEFDVLVGINLLREGLDLPEVSLVAILDADKEGFLRSAGALIQTSGRAARNVEGRVIMYADVMTASMRAAHRRNGTAPRASGRLQRGARHHADEHHQVDRRCDVERVRAGLPRRPRSAGRPQPQFRSRPNSTPTSRGSRRTCAPRRPISTSRRPRRCGTRSSSCAPGAWAWPCRRGPIAVESLVVDMDQEGAPRGPGVRAALQGDGRGRSEPAVLPARCRRAVRGHRPRFAHGRHSDRLLHRRRAGAAERHHARSVRRAAVRRPPGQRVDGQGARAGADGTDAGRPGRVGHRR